MALTNAKPKTTSFWVFLIALFLAIESPLALTAQSTGGNTGDLAAFNYTSTLLTPVAGLYTPPPQRTASMLGILVCLSIAATIVAIGAPPVIRICRQIQHSNDPNQHNFVFDPTYDVPPHNFYREIIFPKPEPGDRVREEPIELPFPPYPGATPIPGTNPRRYNHINVIPLDTQGGSQVLPVGSETSSTPSGTHYLVNSRQTFNFGARDTSDLNNWNDPFYSVVATVEDNYKIEEVDQDGNWQVIGFQQPGNFRFTKVNLQIRPSNDRSGSRVRFVQIPLDTSSTTPTTMPNGDVIYFQSGTSFDLTPYLPPSALEKLNSFNRGSSNRPQYFVNNISATSSLYPR